jgi:hypothetical protein
MASRTCGLPGAEGCPIDDHWVTPAPICPVIVPLEGRLSVTKTTGRQSMCGRPMAATFQATTRLMLGKANQTLDVRCPRPRPTDLMGVPILRGEPVRYTFIR